MTLAAIEQNDYQALTLAFQDVLGVLITEQQRLSLLAKLHGVMQLQQLGSITELAKKIRDPKACELNTDILDAITVDDSQWFQYPTISHLLHQHVLKNLANESRIWVVGCGEGSLAYSIAMDVAEFNRLNEIDKQVSVVATDVSADAIKRAQAGRYCSTQMQGLPERLRASYMRKCDKQGHVDSALEHLLGEHWEISPKLREMVSFEQCDILNGTDVLGMIDVIICPEVLVYFSSTDRSGLLEKFSRQLSAGGVFLTAEDQPIVHDGLERVLHPDGVFYRQKF